MKQTFNDTVAVTRMVWASFVGLAKGQFGINDVSGPVGLASALTDVAGESLKVSFVNAVISIVYVMTVITINNTINSPFFVFCIFMFVYNLYA